MQDIGAVFKYKILYMKIDYEALGRQVKQQRKKLKLSQKELAGRIGISVPYMSNIENGKTKFGLRVLADLADAMGITPGILMSDREDCGRRAREMLMEEIDRQLSDCTELQLLVLEQIVRDMKRLLKWYDGQ